jgi:hypothetical protein
LRIRPPTPDRFIATPAIIGIPLTTIPTTDILTIVIFIVHACITSAVA